MSSFYRFSPESFATIGFNRTENAKTIKFDFVAIPKFQHVHLMSKSIQKIKEDPKKKDIILKVLFVLISYKNIKAEY